MSLRDDLAAYAHDAWAGWMRYLFENSMKGPGGSVNIPALLVARWQRQMNTPYADLPPNEQASDRTEADRMLAIVQAAPAMSAPSAAERAELQRLYEATSPGPWVTERTGYRNFRPGCNVFQFDKSGATVADCNGFLNSQADAAFIAAAHELVPGLLAALTESETHAEAMEASRDRWQATAKARAQDRDSIHAEYIRLCEAVAGVPWHEITGSDQLHTTLASLRAERDSARDEAALWKQRALAMNAQAVEVAFFDSLMNDPPPATQPPLPDPAAPQQLGLLEDC